MKVAKIINNEFLIQSIYEMFPNISFPDIGVPDLFLEENSLYRVIDSITYNPETQIFRLLEKPLLIDNTVYTVEIIAKTTEEIKSEKLLKVRKFRDDLLNISDIYVTIDRWETYSEDKKNAWRQYRQDLRDLPQTIQDLDNINWPIKPGTNNNQTIQDLININS
jgi:hypothetical protein